MTYIPDPNLRDYDSSVLLANSVSLVNFVEGRTSLLCLSGESRYHCFAVMPLGDGTSTKGIWNVKKVEHMDESDPVNDLEDFPAETMKEVKILIFSI